LAVASTLADPGKGMSVVIGDRDNLATFGNATNPSSPLSSVTLTGNNSYSGGTYFSAGKLLLGNSNALGTGALLVDTGSSSAIFGPARLGAMAPSLTIHNQIVLGSTLSLAGPYNFTLAGDIVDP